MKDENKMKSNIALVAVITLLIGGGVGFFGGMTYQKNQRSAQFGQFAGGGFGRGGTGANGAGGGNRLRNGGSVVGDIIANDTSSITVKLQDGSSKIVLVTSSTSINKATQAAVGDLSVGQRVAVFGSTNADGSVTAQNVQLNPVMRGPNGPSAAGRAGGGTPGQ